MQQTKPYCIMLLQIKDYQGYGNRLALPEYIADFYCFARRCGTGVLVLVTVFGEALERGRRSFGRVGLFTPFAEQQRGCNGEGVQRPFIRKANIVFTLGSTLRSMAKKYECVGE